MLKQRVGRVDPEALVASLDPPAEAVLKEEEGTLIWREARSDRGPVVAKMYRHRGRWSAIRCSLSRFRVERECLRLKVLEDAGVRCTSPLAWATGHVENHGCFEILLMEEVPRATQLGEFVRARNGAVDLEPLFRLVRRMHEAGFCHQTLYAKNILVEVGAAPENAYVLSDVPRSWIFPSSIVGTSMARYDLLDLLLCLEEEGLPRDSVPVAAYGPAPNGSPLLPSRPAGWNSRTKRRRLLRDAAARCRWAAAWALVPLSSRPIGRTLP